MSDTSKSITSWPDLAEQLYDKLTIDYSFENFTLEVPSKVGPDAVHTKWFFNGSLKISTKNA